MRQGNRSRGLGAWAPEGSLVPGTGPQLPTPPTPGSSAHPQPVTTTSSAPSCGLGSNIGVYPVMSQGTAWQGLSPPKLAAMARVTSDLRWVNPHPPPIQAPSMSSNGGCTALRVTRPLRVEVAGPREVGKPGLPSPPRAGAQGI